MILKSLLFILFQSFTPGTINETYQPDSLRSERYLAMGESFREKNLDLALRYVQKSIRLAQCWPKSRLLARGYLILGQVYFKRSEFTQSLTSFQQAEHIGQAFAPDSILLAAQIGTAMTRRNQGDYPGGLRLSLAALKAYDKQPGLYGREIGRLYTELGVIYDHMHRYDLALIYHQKRLDFAYRVANKTELYMACVNIGFFYAAVSDNRKAWHYNKQALALAIQLNSSSMIAKIHEQLGGLAYCQQQYYRAVAYHKRAAIVHRRMGAKEITGYNLSALAQDYLALRKYPEALAYASQAIHVLRHIKSAHYLQQALVVKSELLQRTGKHRDALRVILEAQSLKDSLTGIDKQKTIAQLQASYDLDRKLLQISSLKKDLTIQKQAARTLQLQLSLAQQQRIIYLISVLLLGLLLSISYISFRKQQKARYLLHIQKEEIVYQANQLTELNVTKDKLFSLVSHDLRSPVARLKQNLRQLRIKNQLSPGLTVPFGQLEDQVDQILNLVTNLLDWSHTQLKGFQVRTAPVQPADLVADVINELAEYVRQKEIVLLNQINHDTYVLADKHQLTSVIRNVLGNSVKFTPAKGYIRLCTEERENYVEIQVHDSGIGMSAEQVNCLFTTPFIRSGTSGEPGTGLGLRLCRELLTNQSGSLLVKSWLNKGTTVCIRLPKSFVESRS